MNAARPGAIPDKASPLLRTRRCFDDTRPSVAATAVRAFHAFSIVHCSGCWCSRAKSITCVTLVSATS